MALSKPFAENGDKVKISENKTDNGVLNYDEGFGQRYEQPIKAVIDDKGNITSTGGLQITRPQFNGLMNEITTAIIENQNAILANQQAIKDNLAKIGALRVYADNRFSGCAGLDLPNVFSQLNQFKGGIEASKATFSATTSIINPTLWKDLKDNDVPTKRQILDNVSFDSAVASGLAYVNKQNVFTQPQMYDSSVTSNIILPNEAFLPKSALGEIQSPLSDVPFWDKNVNISLNKLLDLKKQIYIRKNGSGDFPTLDDFFSYIKTKKVCYKDYRIDCSGEDIIYNTQGILESVFCIGLSGGSIKFQPNSQTTQIMEKLILLGDLNNYTSLESQDKDKVVFFMNDLWFSRIKINTEITISNGHMAIFKDININRQVNINSGSIVANVVGGKVDSGYFFNIAGIGFLTAYFNNITGTNKCNIANNTLTINGYARYN